ncbi:hypothetical protein ES703_63924 [subsurface metagenome]
MNSNQLELQIEAKPENLSVIADFIATTTRQFGTEQDMFEVQTAVDEACTNVMACLLWQGRRHLHFLRAARQGFHHHHQG